MEKAKKVINYYVLCNKLKDVIRTGWKDWNVKRERVESVAEHIFGVEMLAIAMNSEFDYKIDIEKVIYMIAIHELGEIIIGDLTSFEITREEKKKIEHKAVHTILEELIDGNHIEELFLEFDEHETAESKFAYQCDKLECDLQCKLYDEENCVDFENQKEQREKEFASTKEHLENSTTWSEAWLKNDLKAINYDDNFQEIMNYALENKIGANNEK